MLSIIIPAYREPFLGKTIQSILENATGEIEVIPILDGWQPENPIPQDSKVKPLHLKKNHGKRDALNAAIEKCRGEFVMELDAHCIVGHGFDEILTKNIKPNWLVVPRRYSLNPQVWQRDDSRPIVDYHYLSFPIQNAWGFGFYARPWDGMSLKKRDPKYNIDELMTIQASCWVANKEYLKKHILPLDSKTYGSLAQDQQELSLKYWLKGGQVMVNKNTWYAHVSKRWYHYSQGLFSRKHKKDSVYIAGNTWGTWHWLNNQEPGQIHKFEWLIEKFWPVPEWPENWKEEIEKLRKQI